MWTSLVLMQLFCGVTAASFSPPERPGDGSESMPIPDSGPALLDRVFLEQEKSLERVSNYTADLVLDAESEHTFQGKRRRDRQHVTARQWQKGGLLRAVTTRNSTTSEWANDAWTPPISLQMTDHDVLALGYRASWSVDHRNPNDRLLGSLQIHDKSDQTQTFGGGCQSLIYSAFGSALPGFTGYDTLRGHQRRCRPEVEWKAEYKSRGARNLVIISLSIPRPESNTVAEFEIDPACGWMTVGFTYNGSPKGGEFPRQQHARIEPVRDASGAWFPKSIDIRTEFFPAAKSHEWSNLHVEVTGLDLTTPIPDTEFTWQRLGYQGGFGFHTDGTGKREKIVVIGYEWKPFSQQERQR